MRFPLNTGLFLSLATLLACTFFSSQSSAREANRTWMADNGNGTYTNPLFFDEFSDPDLIRVGEDFYMTGTSMHTMPGLPVLHSRDLVNWRFLSYACETLDLGPEYRLEKGDIYGRGIWAPSFRHHKGTYYIFSNVNGRKTQLFRATQPTGPWTRSELGSSLHDLSVLFDDDDKVYVVWGYDSIQFAEMKPDMSDIKHETRRTLIAAGRGMGEGSHFYKIEGRYYIISANYDPVGYMVCARADRPEGPYEITSISARESFGVGTGWRLEGQGRSPGINPIKPAPGQMGTAPMHQGGIVQTATGEWWGFSMMDHNSVGRLTCLSPVTWKAGWPYFGLPGNLQRSPRTWVKPRVAEKTERCAPYERNDEFSGPKLKAVWQWNHVPEHNKWSLTARPGFLRLHTLPAANFPSARNTITQRAIGPESNPVTELELSGLKDGDVAGLGLLNHPHAWLAVQRQGAALRILHQDELTGTITTEPIPPGTTRMWLRARCDFVAEQAEFDYSVDGKAFKQIGPRFTMIFQLRTFQGVRYSLFAYNTSGRPGGYADFDSFTVEEPQANGTGNRIPVGKLISLASLADTSRLVAWKGLLRPMSEDSIRSAASSALFRVLDRGSGRVALQAADGSGLVYVSGQGGYGEVRIGENPPEQASTFQWQDMLGATVMLLSLETQRHLQSTPHAGGLCAADAPGAQAGEEEGACFRWKLSE